MSRYVANIHMQEIIPYRRIESLVIRICIRALDEFCELFYRQKLVQVWFLMADLCLVLASTGKVNRTVSPVVQIPERVVNAIDTIFWQTSDCDTAIAITLFILVVVSWKATPTNF